MPWVVFEGIDGVGKTTQARALAAYLRRSRRLPVLYRHVFDTEVGRAQRRLFMELSGRNPLLEILLLTAARAAYMQEFILNPRFSRHLILTDRFFHSILSMQGQDPGVDPGLTPALAAAVMAGRRPDLILLLDAHPATCRARLRQVQPLDRIESRSLEFHARVRAAFLRLVQGDPRVEVVDAEPGFWEVQARIRQVVRDRVLSKAGWGPEHAV